LFRAFALRRTGLDNEIKNKLQYICRGEGAGGAAAALKYAAAGGADRQRARTCPCTSQSGTACAARAARSACCAERATVRHGLCAEPSSQFPAVFVSYSALLLYGGLYGGTRERVLEGGGKAAKHRAGLVRGDRGGAAEVRDRGERGDDPDVEQAPKSRAAALSFYTASACH
jgi:hypothetical protein